MSWESVVTTNKSEFFCDPIMTFKLTRKFTYFVATRTPSSITKKRWRVQRKCKASTRSGLLRGVISVTLIDTSSKLISRFLPSPNMVTWTIG